MNIKKYINNNNIKYIVRNINSVYLNISIIIYIISL